MESLDQKGSIPQRDRAMRECRRPNLPSQSPLKSADLVLQVLSLLAQRAFARLWADGFDRVANTFDFAFHAIADDGEVGGESAVVVDEKDVFEVFSGVAADELSDDFAADGRPDVIDAVGAADGFGIVERGGAVAVGDYENVVGGEDLEGGVKGGADDSGRFVAGDEEGGVVDAWGFLRVDIFDIRGHRRLVFEEDEEGGIGVARIRSASDDVIAKGSFQRTRPQDQW